MAVGRSLSILLALLLLPASTLIVGAGATGHDAPTVTVQAPAEGATVDGTVTVSGTAQAPHGTVDAVEVRIDQGAWEPAQGTENWTYDWDTTTVGDGPHTIHARAHADGNTSEEVVRNVTVDNANEPPMVSLEDPADGSTVSGTVTVSGTASDPDGSVTEVEVRIDGGGWEPADGTDTWSWAWDTTTLTDGQHTVEARSHDGANHSEIVAHTVTTENEDDPPQVVIDHPNSGSRLTGSVVIRGSATDADDPVDGVEVRLDAGPWTTADGTGSWSWAWDTTTAPDGQHTIEARASAGGQISELASVTVRTENEQQPPRISLQAPEDGARLNGTVTVSGSASDPDGDPLTVEVRIDQGTWRQATGASAWSYAWNTSTTTDGEHVLQARVHDGHEHIYTELRGVTVDNGGQAGSENESDEEATNQAPRAWVHEPVEDATVSGEVNVTGIASDPEGNLSHVELRIDKGPWLQADGLSPWSHVWNTTALEDGAHILEVRAVDGQGTGASVVRFVQVDNGGEALSPASVNQDPELTLTSPEDGATAAGTLLVEGTVDDPDDALLAAEVRIDEGTWEGTSVQPGQPFTLKVNLSGLQPGTHTLTVQVTDGENATDTIERSFTISGEESAPASPRQETSAAAVGAGTFLVLLLLGLGGLVLWGRQ